MPWSNVNLVLNSRDRTSGSYQAALFNAENQNIVQGQIHSLNVNEVNFPYDIPTIQNGFNVFELVNGSGTQTVDVVVPPGFYTGTELAEAVTTAIDLAGANHKDFDGNPDPIAADDLPTCTYDATSNRFSLLPDINDYSSWDVFSPYTFNFQAIYSKNFLGALGKDIFSIMGFVKDSSNQVNPDGSPYGGSYPTLTEGEPPAVGGSAPLTFTQYIDICSPQLCKFQEFQGGSTTNLARRGDVICRLYVSNNIAVQEAEGQRPFIINRQFYNSRVMKWTAGNSVGTIDIQLYDDVGQPLTTTWQPRSYQITFNVYEGGDEKELVTDAAGNQSLLPKYSPYSPQNARAWSSSSFPMSGR